MLSIQGIYTGREIQPLEEIHMRPNIRVIITFLDDALSVIEPEYPTRTQEESSSWLTTQQFLEKCGGWRDTRSPEEIITDIYAARTTSERGENLWQEAP